MLEALLQGQSSGPEAAEALLESMSEAFVPPNIISYTTVLMSFEKASAWKKGMSLLAQMRLKSVQPDLISHLFSSQLVKFLRPRCRLKHLRRSAPVAEGLAARCCRGPQQCGGLPRSLAPGPGGADAPKLRGASLRGAGGLRSGQGNTATAAGALGGDITHLNSYIILSSIL